LSDHTYLPFDTDADLKEHVSRCIAFDQGIYSPFFSSVECRFCFFVFNVGKDLSTIDLVICLGGDGTLLHVSNMFQKSCPPILSFSMGSLGFLTPFDFKFHEKIVNEVLSGNIAVLLRTRLSCQIVREESNNSSSSNTPNLSSQENDKVTLNNNNDDDMATLALNEVVIDRGPNSYLSNLDLYINDRFITKIQGDGK
jgi:NAD+ kinase